VKDGRVKSRPDRGKRRQLGAFYTPPALVELLVHEVLHPAMQGRSRPPRVIDPSCGDGRLLEAAAAVIGEHYGVDPLPYVVGAELDPEVAAATAARLGCTVLAGDARNLLGTAEHHHAYDVVIGNPPYLSQLAKSTARGGRSSLGGGPYADVAAEFLALSLRLVRPADGRIGLVLPLSILSTRDVAPIRRDLDAHAAIDFCWWANERMFDANVRTCVLGFVTGHRTTQVRRRLGATAQPVPSLPAPAAPASTWSWLVSDTIGIPTPPAVNSAGLLGDIARATADFRDQYYGLVGCVGDDVDGPPLITSGLIDVGICRWGTAPTSFAKQRFAAPRVDVQRLSSTLQQWVQQRLVPKVLVASQTRVIEAVVDVDGAWLPSVPVVSVVPGRQSDLWRVAAVLTSPIASALLAHQRAGSGLSSRAIRVTASDLHALPLPSDGESWERAASQLHAGDIDAGAVAMMHAYGCADRDDVLAWWRQNVAAGQRRSAASAARGHSG